MIESVSDFALVDVDEYKDFLEPSGEESEELVSYPARAEAADGMPYDSLQDLDGMVDPPIKCLDPAWLTELVREIEWFRRHGFKGDDVDEPRPVAGRRQPPVVLKDFLEEAHATVRGWADVWENDHGPGGAILVDGAPSLPDSWVSIGSLYFDYKNDFVDEGSYNHVPPNRGSYKTSLDDDDPRVNQRLAYMKILAADAVRDFLSVRLFDKEEPDDDLSEPEFGWTDTPTEPDEKLDQDGGRVTGADFRLLSKQLLSLHSDCEKVHTMLVPLAASKELEAVREESANYAETYTYTPKGKKTETWADWSSAHRSMVDRYSVGCKSVPDDKVLLTGDWYGGNTLAIVTYARSSRSVSGNYTDDDGGRHTAHGSQSSSLSTSGLSPAIEWDVELPEWIEVEDVRVILLAQSLRADGSVNGDAAPGDVEKTMKWLAAWGSFKDYYTHYVALVPAQYDGHRLVVPTIPEIPDATDGGVHAWVEGYDPSHGYSPSDPGGHEIWAHSPDVSETWKGVVCALGAVVDVKFRASVKEE